MFTKFLRLLLSLSLLSAASVVTQSVLFVGQAHGVEAKAEDPKGEAEAVIEVSTASTILPSILVKSLSAGPMVFTVLLVLMFMSVITWALMFAKWFHLRRVEKHSKEFLRGFWDSRSLNELNSGLGSYSHSPVKEVFRNGYAELVKSSHLRETAFAVNLAIEAALDNLTRTIVKTKNNERRSLERFLWVLAISASACPFIGLFGTVWGIMTSFEGIARSGSTSLATVAPGISEALVATAFGLAAAIPAVIGYNIAAHKIRTIASEIDSFGADFLNIVERYLVTDKTKQQSNANNNDAFQAPRI